ncbi:MAG: hypothetical protein ACREDR_45845, partial [Blastocatellia bacterium]
MNQRQKRLWSKDEEEFYTEVKGLIEADRLLAVVGTRDGSSPTHSVDALFDEEDQLEKTVLYAGTFFQNLAPPDFSRVVEALLADSTAMVSVPSREETKDGTSTLRVIEKEVALKKLWQNKKDKLMRRWLRAVAMNDSTRAIAFSDPTVRSSLKTYFEEEQGLYLDSQFKVLLRQGMLFHSSRRIIENMNRLAASMAATYSDEYDKQWLAEVVGGLERYLLEEDGPDREMFQYLNGIQGNRAGWAYWRLSDLLRAFLEESTLVPLVEGSLDQLIKSGLHAPALNLTKRLRFAPNFDEFRWFKRLLDQGDQATREQVESDLYAYMLSLDSGIYDFLNSV